MSDFFESTPVQIGKPASIKVCAEECGAKCCRGPGFVPLTPAEASQLLHVAKRRGRNLIVSKNEAGALAMDHDINGGRCVFLKSNKLCSIYSTRPAGCRNYPFGPTQGCLVAPSDDPDDERVDVHPPFEHPVGDWAAQSAALKNRRRKRGR